MEEKRKSSITLKRLNEESLKSRAVDASAPLILIADDSDSDVYFLLRALEKSGIKNPIVITRSGQETQNLLERREKMGEHAVPRIVFLDMYMPVVSGFDILRWKRSQAEYEKSLFVALSNSEQIKDINRAYDLGANTFLTKPLDRAEVVNLIEAYQEYWSLDKSSDETSWESASADDPSQSGS